MGWWHRGCALAVLAATLSGAFNARAEAPTAADRERARELLFDGRRKLQAGDAAGAVRSFQAAHTIMGVPSTGADLARGLAAAGRLIEARTIALDVTRLPLAPSEPPAFTRARAEAAQLAEALGKRIPALSIRIEGAQGAAVEVRVDGTPVPEGALELPWKVDPGEHEVTASAPGFHAERRTVRVYEGEALPVDLRLEPEPAQPDALGAAAPPPAAAATPVAARERPDEGAPGAPAWVWIAGGAGLAAIGAGVAFAVDHGSVRGTVTDDCPDNLCASAARADELEGRWDRSLGLAVGLGAAGLVGVGAAIYGLATAGAPRASEDRAGGAASIVWSPWVSAAGAGAGVSGRF